MNENLIAGSKVIWILFGLVLMLVLLDGVAKQSSLAAFACLVALAVFIVPALFAMVVKRVKKSEAETWAVANS